MTCRTPGGYRAALRAAMDGAEYGSECIFSLSSLPHLLEDIIRPCSAGWPRAPPGRIVPDAGVVFSFLFLSNSRLWADALEEASEAAVGVAPTAATGAGAAPPAAGTAADAATAPAAAATMAAATAASPPGSAVPLSALLGTPTAATGAGAAPPAAGTAADAATAPAAAATMAAATAASPPGSAVPLSALLGSLSPPSADPPPPAAAEPAAAARLTERQLAGVFGALCRWADALLPLTPLPAAAAFDADGGGGGVVAAGVDDALLGELRELRAPVAALAEFYLDLRLQHPGAVARCLSGPDPPPRAGGGDGGSLRRPDDEVAAALLVFLRDRGLLAEPFVGLSALAAAANAVGEKTDNWLCSAYLLDAA
eukprot:gene2809-10482_t